MMKTVAIWGISPGTRLKLKLLAVVHGRTMAEEVSELIEKAFQRDDTSITDKMMRRVRRIIRRR
jgi:predicted DNA-binding protein